MPELYGTIGAAGINAASNIFGTIFANEEAERRERNARAENYELGEAAAQNADIRTRALYHDLYSPQAQLQQIKEAGLSPSVFYGDGGGMAGQTGAQGTGAAGVSPSSVFGISPIDLASIRKLNAETEKIKEETKTEAGTNKRGKSEINSIIEKTNNTALKNVWQEYENTLAEINTTVEASLQEEKIRNYIEQTRYLTHMTRSAAAKGDIDEASKNDVIAYLKERTQNLMADTLLKQANKELAKKNVQLTEQQVKDLVSQITTREGQLNVNKETLKAQIAQWAVTNGFTEKELSQELTNIIWSNVNGSIKTLAELINSFM